MDAQIMARADRTSPADQTTVRCALGRNPGVRITARCVPMCLIDPTMEPRGQTNPAVRISVQPGRISPADPTIMLRGPAHPVARMPECRGLACLSPHPHRAGPASSPGRSLLPLRELHRVGAGHRKQLPMAEGPARIAVVAAEPASSPCLAANYPGSDASEPGFFIISSIRSGRG